MFYKYILIIYKYIKSLNISNIRENAVTCYKNANKPSKIKGFRCNSTPFFICYNLLHCVTLKRLPPCFQLENKCYICYSVTLKQKRDTK